MFVPTPTSPVGIHVQAVTVAPTACRALMLELLIAPGHVTAHLTTLCCIVAAAAASGDGQHAVWSLTPSHWGHRCRADGQWHRPGEPHAPVQLRGVGRTLPPSWLASPALYSVTLWLNIAADAYSVQGMDVCLRAQLPCQRAWTNDPAL